MLKTIYEYIILWPMNDIIMWEWLNMIVLFSDNLIHVSTDSYNTHTISSVFMGLAQRPSAQIENTI